jgi:hypothetical protein
MTASGSVVDRVGSALFCRIRIRIASRACRSGSGLRIGINAKHMKKLMNYTFSTKFQYTGALFGRGLNFFTFRRENGYSRNMWIRTPINI